MLKNPVVGLMSRSVQSAGPMLAVAGTRTMVVSLPILKLTWGPEIVTRGMVSELTSPLNSGRPMLMAKPNGTLETVMPS
ncbi:hypothetical protein MYIN104542_29530 [Mycobacterium intermedium]